MANRLLCDVLSEMRKCTEILNFSYLSGLIEEAQTLGNRMEAGLGDKRDCKYYDDKLKGLKAQMKEAEEIRVALDGLRKEKKNLEAAINKARYQYKKDTKGDTNLCTKCGSPFMQCECLG